MSNKQSTRVLLIVTGGIAVYKAAVVTRLLKKNNSEVRVIMTKSATEFVTPLTFETLSGNSVGVDMFKDMRLKDPLSHISFADWCTHLLVCPATANFIAKMTSGIADDLASSCYFANQAPVYFCPAMNTGMYNHPATRRNIKTLKDWSHTQIGPGKGDLACNTSGEGRMAEPEEIINVIFKSND